MARIILLVMTLVFFQGCTKKQLIDPPEIVEIIIKSNASNATSDATIITDKERIRKIIELINEGSEEMIKFYSKWDVIMVDSNKKEYFIMCSENSIKFDGKTYRIKRNIEPTLFN